MSGRKHLTVERLIAALQQFPPNATVSPYEGVTVERLIAALQQFPPNATVSPYEGVPGSSEPGCYAIESHGMIDALTDESGNVKIERLTT